MPISLTKRPRQQSKDKTGVNGVRDNRLSKRSAKQSNDGTNSKWFACPFWAFDSYHYSRQNQAEPRYHHCSELIACDISRLKQHLNRKHALPKYCCLRCYEAFETTEQMESHILTNPSCEANEARRHRLYGDRMTKAQSEALNRRSPRGDQVELWYRIFSILFPNAPRPLSPLKPECDPAGLAYYQALVQALGPEEFWRYIKEREQATGDALQLDVSMRLVLTGAFELCSPGITDRDKRPSEPSSNTQSELSAEHEAQQINHRGTGNPEDFVMTHNTHAHLPQPKLPSVAIRFPTVHSDTTQSLGIIDPAENWPYELRDPNNSSSELPMTNEHNLQSWQSTFSIDSAAHYSMSGAYGTLNDMTVNTGTTILLSSLGEHTDSTGPRIEDPFLWHSIY